MRGELKTKSATYKPATLEDVVEQYGDRVATHAPFEVIGIVNTSENGCCADLPVLLTSNPAEDFDGTPFTNYSCQCACDGWCTTGHTTPEEAIRDYQRMTRKERERER